MPQLITIGETMAAFTPDSVGALRYVQNFGIRTAGAESNVAVGLAKLGLEAAWVSRLGTDEFGYFIRNQLRAEVWTAPASSTTPTTAPVSCSRRPAWGRPKCSITGRTAPPATCAPRM